MSRTSSTAARRQPIPSTRGAARPVVDLPTTAEQVESVRVSRSHAEAVRLVAELQGELRPRERPGMTHGPVDLFEVLATLTARRIPFVLIGAHGISGWTGRPRNTIDIDLLVRGGRNHTRAVKALRQRFPQLEARDFEHLTAFFPPGERQSLIDVVMPHRRDLERMLDTAVLVEDRGLRYRVARLESALASKYGAMLNPLRDVPKRMQDAVDFAWMVKHAADPGRKPIDQEALRALGEMVRPQGGGDELLRLVERVGRGEMPFPGQPHTE